MKAEKIIVYKKHILLDRDEVILVDTGSPVSYNKSGVFEFGGQKIDCSKSTMGVDCNYLSKELGRPIMGLIGMDTLNKYDNVVFDYANNQIILNCDVSDENLTALNSNNIMNVPCVDLEIGGRVARMFLDTGAPVSYISKEFIIGKPCLATVKDFHPIYGEFTSETYSIPVKLKGQEVEMVFGNLPASFQLAIGLIGVAGIIGFEFFSRTKVMLRNNKLFLVD